MWRSPTSRQRAKAKRAVEALFDTPVAALYRLVRMNMHKGREPLALHKGPADGEERFYLSALTDERVKRGTFVGAVDARTTPDDLKAMVDE